MDQYGTGDAFQVRDGGAVKFTVDTYGNVGIGTTTPQAKLNVLSDINSVKVDYTDQTQALGNWTVITPFAKNWYDICWSAERNLFVAIANSSSGTNSRILTSSDAISWTSQAATTLPDNYWGKIIYAPAPASLFVVTTYYNPGLLSGFATSPDALTWTTRSVIDGGWGALTYAPEIPLFVVISQTGTNNAVARSSNGITWTTSLTGVNIGWNSVCWAPEYTLFVAVGNNGIMTSPNGISWTSRSIPVGTNYSSVCWAKEVGLFVAVATGGTGNRVITSTNGINWVTRSSAADLDWKKIVWAPEISHFVVAGNGGKFMISFNGIDWLTRIVPTYDWFNLAWSSSLLKFASIRPESLITATASLENCALFIKSNGNVGIGTTNPLTKLHVNGYICNSHCSFSAIYSSYITVSPGQNIAYNTLRYNIGSAYNTSTYIFTCPVKGIYYFSATGVAVGAANTLAGNLYIYNITSAIYIQLVGAIPNGSFNCYANTSGVGVCNLGDQIVARASINFYTDGNSCFNGALLFAIP